MPQPVRKFSSSLELKYFSALDQLSLEKKIREFLKGIAGPNNALGPKELKKAFSELGSYFPAYRAKMALMLADADGDGLIVNDSEIDALVRYILKTFQATSLPRVRQPENIKPSPAAKPLSAEQIRQTFMRHVNPDNVLGWNELKAAFSKLGASYPEFRADRALVFADANGDGLIVTDYEMDELVSYAWLVFWKPSSEPGMFLSDEQLTEVFRKFEDDQKVLSRKDLKKAFNHFGLFFPEYAENVLDPNRTGCAEIKQLDDLVMHASRLGYTVN